MIITDFYGQIKKMAIAADHGGFEQKEELKKRLAFHGFEIRDYGPFSYDACDDYSDFGMAAAFALSKHETDCGVLICRSGVGMSIAANRFSGVRAALAYDAETARKSREHNCSNMLVLPGDRMDIDGMCAVIKSWFATPFSADARHLRRLKKIDEYLNDTNNISKKYIA